MATACTLQLWRSSRASIDASKGCGAPWIWRSFIASSAPRPTWSEGKTADNGLGDCGGPAVSPRVASLANGGGLGWGDLGGEHNDAEAPALHPIRSGDRRHRCRGAACTVARADDQSG